MDKQPTTTTHDVPTPSEQSQRDTIEPPIDATAADASVTATTAELSGKSNYPAYIGLGCEIACFILGLLIPLVGFIAYVVGAFLGVVFYAISSGDYKDTKAPPLAKVVLIVAVALFVLFIVKCAMFFLAIATLGTLAGSMVTGIAS